MLTLPWQRRAGARGTSAQSSPGLSAYRPDLRIRRGHAAPTQWRCPVPVPGAGNAVGVPGTRRSVPVAEPAGLD